MTIRIEYMDVAQRAMILDVASWLLDEWPNRFIKFCEKNAIWKTDLMRDMANAPDWYSGVIEKHLTREHWRGKRDLRYDFLEKKMRRQLKDKDIAAKEGKVLLG